MDETRYKGTKIAQLLKRGLPDVGLETKHGHQYVNGLLEVFR